MIRSTVLPSLLSALALLAPAPRAGAADLEVPGTYPTIEDAVDASYPGDVILVDGAFVSEPATTAITIGHDLTVRGVNGRPSLIRGDPALGFLRIDDSGGTVTLEGLRFDGEDATPSLRLAHGQLVLRDVQAVNGRSTDSGGLIQVEADAANRLIIEDSELAGGHAVGHGGLVAVLAGDLVIEESELTGGQASGAGNGGLVAVLAGDATIRRSLLSGGSAFNGGLVHIVSQQTSLIEDTTMSGGSASEYGGALHLRGSDVMVRRSRIEVNEASGDRGGGAIYNEGPSVTVEDSRIIGNVSQGGDGGGAVTHRNNVGIYRRVLFCDNVASEGDGGAIRLHGNRIDVENSIFLRNHASGQGGAVWVRNSGSSELSLTHASISSSSAGDVGQAAWSDKQLDILDSYIADHSGTEAVEANDANEASTAYSAYTNNTGGDIDNDTSEGLGNQFDANSLIPPPSTKLACDPLWMLPPLNSPLNNNASDGTNIGAFPTPNAWDVDVDGVLALDDCNDTDDGIYPGAAEHPGDGIDSDCDGDELCYVDTDGDGFGEGPTVESSDLDCDDPGEADNTDDVCIGFDDSLDADGDGTPDDCDLCPSDAADDSDGDGSCDSEDLCPGFDDRIDSDSDGIPNGCDDCDSPDDADGDGTPDDCDLCPGFDDAANEDGDNMPDGCDPCPDDPNPSCDGLSVPPTDTGTETDLIEDRSLTHGQGFRDRSGCGCASGPTVPPWGIALGLLGALRRRRARGV